MNDSELVLGIITTIGTDTSNVIDYMKDQLAKFSYTTEIINVSTHILNSFSKKSVDLHNEYDRINYYMESGNDIRISTNDATILMKGVASLILQKRDSTENPSPREKVAYIIKSIKHPKEAEYLKRVYGDAFHLIGISSEIEKRYEFLEDVKAMTHEQAADLIKRDSNESDSLGQHTQDAFQNSDYFINVGDNTEEIKNCVFRLIDLLFGNPFISPTFEEYAMFMAYAASLRSADLSRQIGAVVTKDDEILSSGVNDCPRFGGGLYWQQHADCRYFDVENGRDYKLGYDSNKKEQTKIIKKILTKLNIEINDTNISLVKDAGIGSLTEYGRVVHAEMEALLSCARNNISSRDTVMYVTTFPCHNCAKHIIAAGVKKVVYIEPYPKSKAFDFYKAEISNKIEDDVNKIIFIPFAGVGPRRFVDLFAMSSSRWGTKIRKDNEGTVIPWERSSACLRNPINSLTYLDYEKAAYVSYFDEISKGENCHEK